MSRSDVGDFTHSWLQFVEVGEQVSSDAALGAVIGDLAFVATALHEVVEQLLRLDGLSWLGDSVGAAQVEGDLWAELEGVLGELLPRGFGLREVSALRRYSKFQCVQDIKLIKVAWARGGSSELRPNEKAGLLEFAEFE